MARADFQGLPVTLTSAEAVAEWNAVQRAFLAHSAATPEHLGKVLELEPGFALGWAAKGLFYLLLGRSELVPVAREAHDNAEHAAAEVGATARERRYIDALTAYLAGRPSTALTHLEAVLAAHPEDGLAMKLDQAIRFILGDRKGMERVARQVIPAYGAAHPLAGYAQGCLGFALEENGQYDAAEMAARAGLEMAPDDAWGLHAIAHVYDMTARNDAGAALLEGRVQSWEHCNNFGYHVWWHLGLFYLDEGEFDRVLALYDTKIRADKTDDFRDISNGASMLVRLEIEGVDVGDRWEELGQLAAGRVEDGAVVFADLHYLLSLQGSERRAEADALIARIAADAQRSDHDMHEVADLAGLPCALGLAAFRAGNYGLAFEKLRAVRPLLQRVGGSHAQRDVFSRLAIEAGLRARRWEETEAELDARVARRGAADNFTTRRRDAISRARVAEFAAE